MVSFSRGAVDDEGWNILLSASCLLSLAYYAMRGSKFGRRTSRVLYKESFVSGVSYRDVVSRFCTAGLALVVTVTEDELWMRPFKGFYVMFLPSLSDLEHCIGLS
jgi:hypothetical protein